MPNCNLLPPLIKHNLTMTKKCAVNRCTNRRRGNISRGTSFFRLMSVGKQWVTRLNLSTDSPNACICYLHFKRTDLPPSGLRLRSELKAQVVLGDFGMVLLGTISALFIGLVCLSEFTTCVWGVRIRRKVV